MSQPVAPVPGGEITLEITDAAGARHIRAFPRGVLYIGSTPACDLRLDGPGLEGVSAILDLDPSPTLSDLSSREGPLINGFRSQLGALSDGDTFQVGGYTLRVSFSWMQRQPAPGALVARLYWRERFASERLIRASGLVIDGRGALRDFDAAAPMLRLEPTRPGRVRAQLYTGAPLFYDGAPYANQDLGPGAHLYLSDWRIQLTTGDPPQERATQWWRGIAEAPGALPLYAAPLALARVGPRARREVWRGFYTRPFSLRTEHGQVRVQLGRETTFTAQPLQQRPAPTREALAEALCVPLRGRLARAVLFSATGELLMPGDLVEVRGHALDEDFSAHDGGPRLAPQRRTARILAEEVRAAPLPARSLWDRLRHWLGG